MWEIISSIAAALGTIAAAVSLVFAVRTQKKSVDRERRQATIEAYARLQEEVLDKLADIKPAEAKSAAENCFETEEERKIYHGYKVLIARLEHFAVGIAEDTYDFHTFCLLGGVHVKYLYEKVEPIIMEARNHTGDGSVPYAAFEKLYQRLKKELNSASDR